MIHTLKHRLQSLFNDKRFQEILHGSLYSIFAKILTMLLGIVTSVIGARYYGAEMLGLVAILVSILSIAGLFSMFGLSTSLLKFVPEFTSRYSSIAGMFLYKKILFLVFFISSLVSVVVYFSADLIANNIFHNEELTFFISILAFILIFRSINNLNISMIRNLKKIKFYALLELLPKIFSIILLLILTFSFYDKYNLIYVLFAIPVIMVFLTSIYLYSISLSQRSLKMSYDLPSYKSILSVSFPMFITGGMFLVIGQTDVIMIGMYRSTSEVGIYSIVLSLSMLTTFILNSVNIMAGPKFSELYHSGDMEELKYVAQKSSKLTFFATLPILLVLILFGEFILSIYGDQFIVGYWALVILITGQFVNAATGSVGYFLDMTGHQKLFRNIIIMSGVMNILLNYILLPQYGIIGAAIASMLSIAFWNLTAAFYIKKIFGFYITYMPKYFKGNK